jgi:hypothetical protein
MFGYRKQIAILREALEWYANREVYRRRGKHPEGSPVRFDLAPIVPDKGARARRALNKVDVIRWNSLPRRLSVALAARLHRMPPPDVAIVELKLTPRED